MYAYEQHAGNGRRECRRIRNSSRGGCDSRTAGRGDEAQDTGESEEPQVIEPETPAPTVTGDENGENSGNSVSAEDTGDKNGAASEDATVGDTGDADEGSIEVAEVGNSEITEIGGTDAAAGEEAELTHDGLGKDAIEETEEETAKKDAKKLEDPTNEDFANAVDISCGDTWDVVLNSEHPFEMYRFTPEQSGYYIITSSSDEPLFWYQTQIPSTSSLKE